MFVLKFLVKFKSGHQKVIQLSDLYQSCGISLFSLYMSESDLYRYDSYGKSQVWSCLLQVWPRYDQACHRCISDLTLHDHTWTRHAHSWTRHDHAWTRHDHTWLYMIIPEADMIIPDFTWSYLERQNHAWNCKIRPEADISLWWCKTGTIHESIEASFGVNSRSKNQFNIGSRQSPACQIISWQKQILHMILAKRPKIDYWN